MNSSDNPENPPSPSDKKHSCITATIGEPHPLGCQLIGANGRIFWLVDVDCTLDHPEAE